MATIVNPQTPYVGPVSLQDGTQIYIHGIAEHHHSQFIISLQSGPNINPRSDTPFVFNPRFDENQVVRNTQSGMSWGHEERDGGFPFQKGQKFHVLILVKHDKYKVSVNGHHFTEYRHRTPMSAVTHLIVEGGIRIQEIRVEVPFFYPGVMGAYPPPPPTFPAAPAYNPPVPFVQNIPGGLYPGKMIFISGIPHPNPSRFSVFLQCSPELEPRDIGFVFDARFNYGTSRKILVRNHRADGCWGEEETRTICFPFSPNVNFDIILLVDPLCFKVAVNNQHLLEFNHRLQPLNRVDTLRIDGDVRLTQVRFQ